MPQDLLQSGEWELALTLIRSTRASGSGSLSMNLAPSSSDSMSSALAQAFRDLESMQRSSSTERLHRLLSPTSLDLQMGSLTAGPSSGSTSAGNSLLSSLLSVLGSSGAAADALTHALPGTQPDVPTQPPSSRQGPAVVHDAAQAAAEAEPAVSAKATQHVDGDDISPSPAQRSQPVKRSADAGGLQRPAPKRRAQSMDVNREMPVLKEPGAVSGTQGQRMTQPARLAEPPQVQSATPSPSSSGAHALVAQAQPPPKSRHKGVSCHKWVSVSLKVWAGMIVPCMHDQCCAAG